MLDINHEYTISEVSDITEYAPHVIRYYEKEFEIDIPRNDSNHRYFTYKEIEILQYIKTLQDKGFSNKQIKLIIKSPDILINNQDRGLVAMDDDSSYLDTYEIAREISNTLEEEFFEKIYLAINKGTEDNIKVVEELKNEVIILRKELNSKERDILICENARLKIRIKEIDHENIRLKQKIKDIEEKEVGFFKKIFGR